jgi:hypothetical protein
MLMYSSVLLGLSLSFRINISGTHATAAQKAACTFIALVLLRGLRKNPTLDRVWVFPKNGFSKREAIKEKQLLPLCVHLQNCCVP